MYDIEFILPACAKPQRFLDRLNAFKRYGLLNIGDYKVNVVILSGKQNIPNVLDNWPCDVEIVGHPKNNHPAPKIYQYYADLEPGHGERARWFFKLDDDSITDVGNLVKQLDEDYDHTVPYYLVVDVCTDLWGPYTDILVRMNIKDKIFPETNHGKWTYIHEWEGCITSSKAMEMIANCELGKEYLAECAKIPGGWGDHAVAVAAVLAKVHPQDASFLTKDPAVEELSTFGGRHHHIHYIAPDKEDEWARFMNYYMFSRQRINDLKKEAEERARAEEEAKAPAIAPEPEPEKPPVQLNSLITTKPRRASRTQDKFYKRIRRNK
jgi:hypothetical protein